MENSENWKRDISKEDANQVELALEYSSERIDDLSFWVAQEAINIDQLQRNSSFLQNRIQYLQQGIDTKELSQILSKAKKLLDDAINLDQIYSKNIVMSSEEEGVVSYTTKTESDEEMLQNLRLKRQSINDELNLIEDIIKEKYPEEYLRIEKYLKISSNKTN